MIDQIEALLNLLRITARARFTTAGVDLDAAPALLGAARQRWRTRPWDTHC
ncbi:hypothetical protein ACIGEZ_24600 [Streptomyces sp. NPDC085481]